MSDRDVDWLDQLCEADEKIAELESENAKLREELEQLKTDRNLRKREDGQ